MDCCGGATGIIQSVEFYLLIGVGLSISLGHCTGMCGPIITAFAISQKQPGVGWWTLTLRLVTYHLGRITSYGVIGVLMGLIGATLFMAGNGPRIQGALSLLIGAVMLVLAAGLLGWLPTTHWVESSALQGVVAGRLRGLLEAQTVPRRLALGLANGWLPCGPVFSAAMAAAATGSVWRGGVAMLAFGIGTVPVLLVLGLGAGRFGVGARRFFNRIGALCVLLIAAQLILRGLAAWSVVPHFRIGEFVVW